MFEQKPGGDKGASQTRAIAALFQAEGGAVAGHGDWEQLGSLKHRQEATELGWSVWRRELDQLTLAIENVQQIA